jgi:hypothetical protein
MAGQPVTLAPRATTYSNTTLNTTPKVVALELPEVGHALELARRIKRSSLRGASPHKGDGKLKHTPPTEIISGAVFGAPRGSLSVMITH